MKLLLLFLFALTCWVSVSAESIQKRDASSVAVVGVEDEEMVEKRSAQDPMYHYPTCMRICQESYPYGSCHGTCSRRGNEGYGGKRSAEGRGYYACMDQFRAQGVHTDEIRHQICQDLMRKGYKRSAENEEERDASSVAVDGAKDEETVEKRSAQDPMYHYPTCMRICQESYPYGSCHGTCSRRGNEGYGGKRSAKVEERDDSTDVVEDMVVKRSAEQWKPVDPMYGDFQLCMDICVGRESYNTCYMRCKHRKRDAIEQHEREAEVEEARDYNSCMRSVKNLPRYWAYESCQHLKPKAGLKRSVEAEEVWDYNTCVSHYKKIPDVATHMAHEICKKKFGLKRSARQTEDPRDVRPPNPRDP